MADQKHVSILKTGTKAWNRWRDDNPNVRPDLSQAKLTGTYLYKADLSGVDLSEAKLIEADLRYADLRNSDLSDADLSEAKLFKADLSRALLYHAKLIEADLRYADLSEANLSYADLSEAKLDSAKLRKAELFAAAFIAASLREARFYKANLRHANLSQADLHSSNLSHADLSQADLSEANLSQAKLTGTYLYNTDCSNAVFNKANLHNADFSQTNLREADLSEANLAKVHFTEAILILVNLTKGNLTGAKLYGTARDDWIIDDIKCDHIFWDMNGKNRFPQERDFEAGEFEKLYKQLPTIEHVFENGFTPIDAFLIDQVVEAINEKHPEFELRLDSFHWRVNPRAVFSVIQREYADKASRQIEERYQNQIKVLEGKYDTLKHCFRMSIQEPRIAIGRLLMKGDDFEISGQAGAVGSHSYAHDMNFNQSVEMASKIDLVKLSDELSQLRQE